MLIMDSHALRKNCDFWHCVAHRRNDIWLSTPDGITYQKFIWPGLLFSFGCISPNSSEPIKGSQYILAAEFVFGELEEWSVKRNRLWSPFFYSKKALITFLLFKQRERKENNSTYFIVISSQLCPERRCWAVASYRDLRHPQKTPSLMHRNA